jgi:parvulin-like peptidyl-prolyl isomerase
MANPAPLDSARAPSGREEAPPPRSAAAEHVGGLSVPVVAATVNAQRITRDDLARECLHQYGKDVLESMVNRQLILQECQRRNLAVTEKEVDAEIDRMAKRFGIPVDKWLKLLQQERNITPSQYAHDIVWPTLALRKLAGERLKVSDEEKAKEFETMYGEAVRARLIAVSNLDKANQLQAQAAANPAEFGDLAKKSSEDAPSAAAKGIIQPIRRHGSYKEIEDAVFHMTDGQVSKVIPVGGQYVIIKREGLIPAKKVSFEEVAPKLEEVVRDSKMRGVAQDVFKQLQDNARVDLVWADPAKHARMPDVAALINGVQITVRDLAQECIERHGLEVLEGMINRKLLEEACRKRNIAVSEEEIQQEIAREAVAGMKPKEDGAPDIAGWMAVITKKRGISADMYRNNVVWPTAVLKKLVQDKVEVNEEDLKKGYEANFGPRVRCLAIVLNNERSAQRVFDLARKNNTRVYFGTLASQYSVEPSSQSLRGEVPPIKMNGGQPVLEKEAFALQPGELSGVISVDDKFVILRCEEFIKPAQIEFAKVRDDLRQDVFQKKLHLAMADFFERLQESAAIDNFLAGTSQSPNQHRGDAKSPAGAAGRSAAPLSSRPSGQVPARSSSGAVPILRQVPGG